MAVNKDGATIQDVVEEKPDQDSSEEVFVFPMSFAQQRLWFLDQFEPNSPFYNIPSAVRLRGHVDVSALSYAINEIIRRHEVLRTTFETVDGEPSQLVHPFQERAFPSIDLSEEPVDKREAKVRRMARREAATPFDLKKGPLLRVTFVKLADKDWVLLITMHHIISDGWSVGVFVREISILYDSFINNRPSPLPDLAIQYGDFAVWQQEHIAGEVLERQIEYWKNKLGGHLPVLEIPGDFPRPAVQTMVGANEDMLVPASIIEPFNDLVRRKGATLFMGLLAAFKILLHRYTGLEDILVGSPIANRNRAEIEPLIGFFVNTLVLRSDLSGDPSFMEVLDRVRQTTVESYDNQDVPFERLVEVLQPDRDMAHSPLFQVMFILQNNPTAAQGEGADITIETLDVDAGTSTFDLTLMASQRPDGLQLSAEFNTDIYLRETMRRLMTHFKLLIQTIVEHPDGPISQIDFLPYEEKQRLTKVWNDFDRDYPIDSTVHHAFQQQVDRTPKNIAVVVGDQRLTYEQLNRRANKLAHRLRKLGVGPDVKVSICMDKHIDLPVAVLGVLKAGGAYVPVDPTYPEDRIAYMLNDSDAAVVLSHGCYRNLVAAEDRTVVLLDADWQEIDEEPEDDPENLCVADNLAYMIYTSGSTGKAKGTMVSHRSILNAYYAWEEDYHLRDGVDSHLQMASFSFDVFGGDFVRALLSGGKLVLAPREMLLDAEQLYRLMRREKVNCAEFVPAVLRHLVEYLDENGHDLSFMKNLIAGSDVWYVSEYKSFRRFCGPQTRLINSFGLTEAAVDSTFFEGDVSDYADERLTPIGRPFGNSKIYIVDEHLNLAPIGVPGELLVAGPNLARGYYKRAELTAEKFIPNPFSEKPGERLYRSGDLARWLPDGNIEFLGRIDNQVKVRGFRIEMGEIESALERMPSVRQAVVIAREDRPGDKRIVGYVVANDGAEFNPVEARAFLKENIPDYMIPSALIVLNALPLTPNGKVDRKALPAPAPSAFEALQTYVPPETETEQKLVAIWQEVLGLPKIGVEDNFFELGGHSLLATQVGSRIRHIFETEIPLRSLFEFVTIRELAPLIDQAATGTTDTSAISKRPPDEPIVPSFAQERLWFLDQLEPGSPFYNISDAVRIKGRLDTTVLQRCLQEIVRRHDVLRTSFHSQNGKPVVEIHDDIRVHIDEHDLSEMPPAEAQQQAEKIIRKEAAKPFFLDQPPLFRVCLIRTSDEEHLFVLTIHHIISDGWSSNVMFREVGVLYESFSLGMSSPLPDLPIQYQDYAWWQRSLLKGELLERELDFWRHTLKEAPPLLNLPTDRPRPAVQTSNGDFKSFRLSDEASKTLNRLAQTAGVTPFMALLAAFYALLYRYSGQDDICVGTPIANRNRSELEGLIGFFVNTLVLRTQLHGSPSFSELLDRVKQSTVNAFQHQDIPFEKIVDTINPQRDLSHSPLFQVMFALQNIPPQSSGGEAELAIEPLDAHSGTAKFDLTLFMVEEQEGYSGALEYNTDLFDDDTIERMIRHFCALVEQAVQHPYRSIDELSIISQEERRLVLYEWNGHHKPLDIPETIVELFRLTAANAADKTAVLCGEKNISYAELDRRSSRLANHLVEQGIGRDQLVALCMERSIELFVAILGILKAGAAYVPIDPAYPEERIALMIEDAQPALIMASERTSELLPSHMAEVLRLDADWDLVKECAESAPRVIIEPQQLAYMIYTSGSTGRPKGTMITHSGLIHYLDWCNHAYPLKQGRGSVVHSSISFDATVTSMFTPLLHGGTAVLIPDEADLDTLAAELERLQEFSVIKITPAHLELLAHQTTADAAPALTKSFIIGGENLVAEQIRFWQQNAPDTLLFNEYGPTETVVGCVVFEAHKWKGKGSVPIGRTITNAVAYVLDENMNELPPGVPGELYIGGAGVARGYWRRPELTAERFVPDPFSDEPGARLYKTGDLVRYMNDGQLIFLDRIDNQVKIRGYRIEPGEIDALLSAQPGVSASITIVREDVPGEKRLVSYFVADAEEAPGVERLYGVLKKTLPEYMVPAALVQLPSLPLTQSGKVDRRALPRPDYSATASQTEYIAPRTEEEKQLAQLFQDILQLDRVGVNDNFFELGGHSLLATQVVSRIRDEFDVELPLRELFEHPTVSALTHRIHAAKSRTKGHVVPPLTPQKRPLDVPLSFAQQRLWFLDQLTPNNPNYNIPAAIRLVGPLNTRALSNALAEIVHRHESLRTIFKNNSGRPSQVILSDVQATIQRIDLSEMAREQQERETRRLIAEEAMAPFQLDIGPLFRATLITLGAEEHIFMFTMHHIISDGWSTNVFMKEIGILYEAFQKNAPSPLPPLTIQYADYAIWQRSWLKDEVLESQLEFWREKIGTSPPVLDLPLDRPRPAMQTSNGDAVATQFSREMSDAVIRVCQAHDVTPFMVLVSAFQALLHRYSRQDTILVGTPIANRTTTETEALIGFFVNTLVLRADFDKAMSFSDLLKQVRQFTLDAYEHQDVPFEQLVDELEPKRDTSRSPIFQVMFVLQNTARQGQGDQLSQLRMQALEPDVRTAKYDLTVVMAEDPGGLQVEFEYNTDLFEKTTITRMLQHFEKLLRHALAAPETEIEALSLLDEVERRWLVEDLNQTDIELPDMCIHELFEQRVKKTPDALAVKDSNRQLTFAELNQQANRLAHKLRSLGIGPEKMVGLSATKSIEMVIGLLAILKAGGVYLPIDPEYPQERIDYILQNAGVTVMLTQPALSSLFSASNATIILLDGTSDDASFSSNNPANLARPENLAYVIYTSGSTGKPKGVMLGHRGLVNLTLEQIKDFKLDESCRCLQFASFSFDASVSEIFTTLISGATLYLALKDEVRPGDELAGYLKKHSITTITLPPSVLKLMEAKDLSSLRTVVSAGEACTRDIVQRWAPGRHFLNAYGPTENTVCASSAHLQHPPVSPIAPIGRPIGNVRLYVLDEHRAPAPVGVPGELCIGGIQLARGYLNRPDLTAASFIPHPFAQEPGERLYCTGDLARVLEDGAVEFLGRIDQQVKLRGFRIELGEIEYAALAHKAVREAVAHVAQSPAGQALVLYLVFHDGQSAPFDEIRQTIQAQLPEYMTPQFFVELPSIPVTPNGKVDRRALPAPDSVGLGTVEFVAPRNELEERIAKSWAAILGRDDIGVLHDFFEIGGHSLLATQLISRLREDLKIELPIAFVFEAPTIAQMAEKLGHKQQTAVEAPPMTKALRTAPVPLSYAQQRLWFLDQLDPGNTAFNLTEAVELEGELDVSALKEAFALLIKRHEVLRTTFAKNDEGLPIQVISEDCSFDFELTDLTGWSTDEIEKKIRQHVAAEQEMPFDLQRGPLIRARLLHISTWRYVIILTMHHIISDAWSIGIFIRELAAAYSAFSAKQDVDLLPLQWQYADFAAWQRSWLTGEVLQREVDYWQEKLRGAPSLISLPTDHPRPPVKTFNGDRVALELAPPIWQKLQELIQQQGVTPFMLMEALFAVFLHRYSGQDDVVIGSPIANRNRLEVESMLGFFVNTLAFRNDLSGHPSFVEFLSRVREAALEAYGHQDVPFEKLVEVLHPDRDLSHTPIFQVMLVYQNAPIGHFEFPSLKLKPLEIRNDVVQYDLILSFQETGDTLSGVLQFNTDLFKKSTAARWARHIQNLAAAVAEQPRLTIDELPLMADAEVQMMVRDWNRTQAEFPRHLCAHQVFEQQALRSPDAPAVRDRNTVLSYRELDGEANKLAHLLRQHGVSLEKRVGICLPRSADMIRAVLAVMKAGGAYVPLDPDYPLERLRYMIMDAGIDLIITHSALEELLPHVERTMMLDRIGEQLEAMPTTGVDIDVHPDNAAYMIYTSGSTGRPKGVLLSHRGISNLSTAQIADFKVRPDSVVLQFASFSFDASVSEIFMALHSGASLYMADRETLTSPSRLSRLLRDEHITVATFPPSLLSVLTPEDVAPLETIVSAGEACPKELANLFGRGRHFVNAYGPTEATVGVCSYWAADGLNDTAMLPIGRPYNNTQLYILDKNMNPVPIGVAGELCIGSVGLARGYHNQPGLTAEKFTPDPFSERPGSRLYHTGDLAAFRDDGSIQFLGRIDEQIKIRGFRVELGEIEDVLASHPDVSDVVVVARAVGSTSPNHIAAYIVSDAKVDVKQLRAFASERLPDYMTPNSITQLDAFPLTPNGKVDKKALPEPVERESLQEEKAPPADKLEEEMVHMFARLLEQKNVGATDDFFELGGHSLMAIQLLSRIEKRFAKEISLMQFYRSPTPRALARVLRGRGSAEGVDPCLAPFRATGDQPPLFLIHPSGGSVHWYTDLAEAFGENQPIFGIQAQGVNGDAELHHTIEDMATHYVKVIKSAHPDGPYLISSWSMGVVIAYETARQLLTAGEKIGMLIMLDQGPHMPREIPQDPTEFLVDMFMGRLKVSKRKLRKMDYDQQLRLVLHQAQRVGLLPLDFTPDTFKRYVTMLKIQMDAWRNYKYQPYSGDLLLIKGEESHHLKASGDDLGWRQYVKGQVHIETVPGNHNSMLWKENVGALAAIINCVIANVASEQGATNEGAGDGS